jgi:hypothetical protein
MDLQRDSSHMQILSHLPQNLLDYLTKARLRLVERDE